MDQDDVRFASFTRDLARRHRRPRSYPPPPPMPQDVLEQLCGGGDVPLFSAPSVPSLATLATLAGITAWSDDSGMLNIDDLDLDLGAGSEDEPS